MVQALIPRLSTLAEPLTLLLRAKQSWKWESEQESAFINIKEALTTAPIVACPDFSQQFTLQTDESGTGLGAVLTQIQDGVERVISYASHTLSKAERNYSATERECLAVVWAIEKFRAYLEADHFTVVTDHHSLMWLKSLKDPTSRLANWSLKLSKYDFDIQYRKGSLNVVPDFLSRLDQDLTELEPVSAITDTSDKWYLKRKADVLRHSQAFPNWKIKDDLLYHHITNKTIDFTIPDLNEWKLVLPREFHDKILNEAHDEPQAGHQGIEREPITASHYVIIGRDITATSQNTLNIAILAKLIKRRLRNYKVK